MDNQGFTASGGTVRDGVRHAAGYVQPGAAGFVPARKVRIAANDVVGTVHGAGRPQADEERIETLRRVQTGADRVTFTGEFIGMIGGGALAWVAGKFNQSKAATVVHAIFTAPFEAMRATKLNNLFELPAHYMRAVSRHAKNAAVKGAQKSIEAAHAGKLTNDEIQALISKTDFDAFHYEGVKGTGSRAWVEGTARRADALEASGKRMAGNVSAALEPATSGIRGAVKSGVQAFEGTALGRAAQRGMERVVTWRADRAAGAYAAHLDKAHVALTKETPGIFQRIGHFFKGTAPAELAAHPALAEVSGHLAKARGASSIAEQMQHTGAAQAALKKVSAAGDASLAGRVEQLVKAVGKSEKAAKALHGLEGAKGAGLTGAVKALGKAAGRIPLFGAILGVSAVAGVSATVLTHRHENKLAETSHDEIMAAIGAGSPLMQRIEQAYQGDGYKHLAKTSLSLVGEVANAAMGMNPHGAGMAMMGAVMLPAVGTMLIKDNVLLNSYANLRQEEKTGKKMSPQDKIECVKQLVASVPAVEAHGGYYNRLTGPVAEAIVTQGIGAVDLMKLLANDQEFTAFAAKVQESQRALAAKGHSNAPVAKAPVMGVAPTVQVSAVQHDGRVQGLQKAASL